MTERNPKIAAYRVFQGDSKVCHLSGCPWFCSAAPQSICSYCGTAVSDYCEGHNGWIFSSTSSESDAWGIVRFCSVFIRLMVEEFHLFCRLGHLIFSKSTSGTNLQTSKRPGIPTSARPLRSIDGLSPGAKALVDAFVAARG